LGGRARDQWLYFVIEQQVSHQKLDFGGSEMPPGTIEGIEIVNAALMKKKRMSTYHACLPCPKARYSGDVVTMLLLAHSWFCAML
jgi:hypothetical protein